MTALEWYKSFCASTERYEGAESVPETDTMQEFKIYLREKQQLSEEAVAAHFDNLSRLVGHWSLQEGDNELEWMEKST